MSTPFIGDAKFIIQNLEKPKEDGEGNEENKEPVEGEGDQPNPLEDSSSDDEIKIPPKNFTELDWLSFTIRAIENDC